MRGGEPRSGRWYRELWPGYAEMMAVTTDGDGNVVAAGIGMPNSFGSQDVTWYGTGDALVWKLAP